jgi:hypothetical protein
MVAYPDEISNTTYLNDLYAEVSARDRYWHNYLILLLYHDCNTG